MADQWAILVSIALLLIGMFISLLYVIPIQGRLIARNKDDLSGLRWLLLGLSIFELLPITVVLIARTLRAFGITTAILSNVSAIAIGIAFLGFSITLVAVYHYKRKE